MNLRKSGEPTSWYPTITRFIGWKIFTGVYYPLAKPLLNLLSISRLLLSSIISVIPGSYVEVYLLTTPQNNVFSIPVTALTEEQGIYFVYLQIAEEEFVKREVGIGESDGKNVRILSGLKGGERVVVKGAYQVKLASSSSVLPEGHSH